MEEEAKSFAHQCQQQYHRARALEQVETVGQVKRIVESLESVSGSDRQRLEEAVHRAENTARFEHARYLREQGMHQENQQELIRNVQQEERKMAEAMITEAENGRLRRRPH